MRVGSFILPVLFVLLAAGCSSKKSDQPAGAAHNEIKVDLIDEAGLRQIITQRHGKILLLNVWATWCPPCVEEFPALVRLADSIDSKKFEIIGISADEPEDAKSKVIPFILKNKVPFRIYIAKVGKQEDFINALNRDWNGAIPATFVYDSTGIQRSFLIGARDFAELRKILEGNN